MSDDVTYEDIFYMMRKLIELDPNRCIDGVESTTLVDKDNSSWFSKDKYEITRVYSNDDRDYYVIEENGDPILKISNLNDTQVQRHLERRDAYYVVIRLCNQYLSEYRMKLPSWRDD